jgi:hypothetical protein
MSITLFGDFEARLEPGPPLSLRTRKSQALLAYLAMPPGHAHSRDRPLKHVVGVGLDHPNVPALGIPSAFPPSLSSCPNTGPPISRGNRTAKAKGNGKNRLVRIL